MTDRRIEIANITRINEIIQDDPKALVIHAYDNGLFAVNFYESKEARKRREAQEAQIRQYQEWKAKEAQQTTSAPQPQPPAIIEEKRGPGRPRKNSGDQIVVAGKVEEAKSKGFLHRKEKLVPPSNRCIVCGSPDANVIKFHVPGAPTDGETRFCKTHSNITDLTNIQLKQVA